MKLFALALCFAGAVALAQNEHAGHPQKPDAPGAGEDMAGMKMPGAAATPKGYVPVKVEAGSVAGFPLEVARVEPRALRRIIRTFGVVTFDETRTSHVHAKVRGTLESVSANFVGKAVKQGEPLADLYSAPVYAAQLDLAQPLDALPRSLSGRTRR
jgi:Cu(I)/Ag(I) efflux system membrane fusion protein